MKRKRDREEDMCSDGNPPTYHYSDPWLVLKNLSRLFQDPQNTSDITLIVGPSSASSSASSATEPSVSTHSASASDAEVSTNNNASSSSLPHTPVRSRWDSFSDYALPNSGTQSMSFKAHKIVLASQSEVFRAMFYGGMKEAKQSEIYIPDVDPNIFHIMLQFFYSGSFSFTSAEVLPLIAAASLYGVEGLKEGCLKRLDLSNCLQLLTAAHTYHEKELTQTCLKFIWKFAPSVFLLESFQEIPKDLLTKILESDELEADEICVFRAALSWLKSNTGEQSAEGDETLRPDEVWSLVRFPLISGQELISEVKPCLHFSWAAIPQKLYVEALEHKLCPSSSSQISNSLSILSLPSTSPLALPAISSPTSSPPPTPTASTSLVAVSSTSLQNRPQFRPRKGSTRFKLEYTPPPVTTTSTSATHPRPLFDEDMLSVEKHGSNSWDFLVKSSKTFEVNAGGKHYWEVVVDHLNKDATGMVVGVVPPDHNESHFSRCIGIGMRLACYHCSIVPGFRELPKVGDRVGVKLDLSGDVVEFYLNGLKMAAAEGTLKTKNWTKVCAGVFLYYNGDKVTFTFPFPNS
eukprot:TRINITY_DN2751_c0_g1_i1.p1 TRINITY_DN2751_c0_g1~~TRINITY_DN2751_c0_g1_i1.p1  ORF type:complete len:576 (-),score=105.01 TRINITY_DN2751_c0_g1_i1:173-1900(-)